MEWYYLGFVCSGGVTKTEALNWKMELAFILELENTYRFLLILQLVRGKHHFPAG